MAQEYPNSAKSLRFDKFRYMKQIKAILIPAVVILGPCLFKFELLSRVEIWFVYLGSVALIWMQPDTNYNPLRKKEEPASDRNSKLAIAMAFYVSTLVSVVFFIMRPAPIEDPLRPLALYSGVLILILGVLIRVWGIRVLGRMFTTEVQIVDNHSLVETGPYKWIRHPTYLGALLMLLSTPILLTQWMVVPVVLLLGVVAFIYRIAVEEEVLVINLGDQYKTYQLRTRKIIPFIY